MALNPQLNSLGEPVRIEGEFFVMKRDGVDFEFKVQNGNKYTGKGSMILTTFRIICLNKKASAFKAFDLPLSLTKGEKFEQPIFGANYLSGTCSPLLNSLPGIITWKIWFMEGGCGVFVPTYLKMVYSMRKNKRRGIDSKMANSIQNGTFKKSAIVDPSDPSVIYLEQPQAIGNYNQPIEMGYIAGDINSNQYMPLNQNIPQSQPMNPYQPMPPQQMQFQPQPNMPPQQMQFQPQPNMPPQYQPMSYQPQQYQPQPGIPPQYQPMPQQNQPVPGQEIPSQYQQGPPQYYPPQENNYPSMDELNNNNNNQYPGNGNNMEVLNGVNLNNNNNQDAPRYFGFWGPQLERTNNNQ